MGAQISLQVEFSFFYCLLLPPPSSSSSSAYYEARRPPPPLSPKPISLSATATLHEHRCEPSTARPLDHLCSASRVPESPQPSLTLSPSLTPSTAPRRRHCWYVLFSSASSRSRGYRITDIVFPSLGELIGFPTSAS